MEPNETQINHGKISPTNIVGEMKKSFLEYSMSVIMSRALPDVRDGLKPVHRRILYSMHENGLTSTAKFQKSARVVGEVLGKYHPHGDTSVYESMVVMAQNFTSRFPLVLGQGNFGSVDGDNAAAYRYTEAKLSKLANEMLRDIEKETIDFSPNFDATRQEPKVLPAAIPNLLLNGCLGIAVGMATDIPPHNLGEVIDALQYLIKKPEATVEELVEECIKGPDFPLGGIIFNKKEIISAYTTGRGGITYRGEVDLEETRTGKTQIVIKSIFFRSVRSNLIERIAKLVNEKKIMGIRDLRDESTSDTRIVVELKNDAIPERVINALYKNTQLESRFNFNMTALVNGAPQVLSLKQMLYYFLEHRKVIVRRRSEFDLKKAQAREHIVSGLVKALDHIDEIIKLIKASKDTQSAKESLMKQFSFSELQALAILDMKLQRLAGLERKKLEEELSELLKIIAYLKDLLASPEKMLTIISQEFEAIKSAHNNERRTIVKPQAVGALSDEDLIPDTTCVVVVTSDGYVKRTDPEEYKKQHRGGKGVSDLNTKEEDVIMQLVTATALNELLFFTNKGKVYSAKAYDIPETKRSGKGKSLMNFLALSEDENVTSILVLPKDTKTQASASVVLITKTGTVKRIDLTSFKAIRKNGLLVMGLDENDELLYAGVLTDSDDVMCVSKEGQSIRFKATDVRVMGRAAGGVRGIRLDISDVVISASVVKSSDVTSNILVATKNGYGKMTSLDEFKVQGRGGSGIKIAQVTEKTGEVVAVLVIAKFENKEDEEYEELLAISKGSQIIRLSMKDVPTLGRATQGVRIMRLSQGDDLVSIAVVR
jgi:DNA gyrase subunit A